LHEKRICTSKTEILCFDCQEFADALREYSPQHDGVNSAEGAAEELEKVKADLEQRRHDKEKQLQKELDG
jgi:hypothetical protein